MESRTRLKVGSNLACENNHNDGSGEAGKQGSREAGKQGSREAGKQGSREAIG
jgi:hypothetical protein